MSRVEEALSRARGHVRIVSGSHARTDLSGTPARMKMVPTSPVSLSILSKQQGPPERTAMRAEATEAPPPVAPTVPMPPPAPSVAEPAAESGDVRPDRLPVRRGSPGQVGHRPSGVAGVSGTVSSPGGDASWAARQRRSSHAHGLQCAAARRQDADHDQSCPHPQRILRPSSAADRRGSAPSVHSPGLRIAEPARGWQTGSAPARRALFP